jgi:hypothetical protein
MYITLQGYYDGCDHGKCRILAGSGPTQGQQAYHCFCPPLPSDLPGKSPKCTDSIFGLKECLHGCDGRECRPTAGTGKTTAKRCKTATARTCLRHYR